MERELKTAYPDLNIKLIKGGGGIFNVKYEGKLIYSKQKIEGNRFPDEGEISKLIREEHS